MKKQLHLMLKSDQIKCSKSQVKILKNIVKCLNPNFKNYRKNLM